MLLTLIAMATVPSVPKTQAATPVVAITNKYNITEPGMTFNITITVTDVTALFTWVINLTWDSNIIKITTGDPDPNGVGDLKRGKYNIYEGPFLKSIRPTVFLATEIDNTNGKIRELVCGYEPAGATPSGSGVLATINFTYVNVGTTTIEINGPGAQGESQLLNSAGKGMSHEDRDGVVTEHGPPPIWTQLWVQVTAASIIVIAVVGTVYVRHKKKIAKYPPES